MKLLLILLLNLSINSASFQNKSGQVLPADESQTQMADVMRSEGKIYVVVCLAFEILKNLIKLWVHFHSGKYMWLH